MRNIFILALFLFSNSAISQVNQKINSDDNIYFNALIQYFDVIEYFQGDDFYLFDNANLLHKFPEEIKDFKIKNLEEDSNLLVLLQQNDNHILAVHFSEIKHFDSLIYLEILDVYINLKNNKIDVNISRDGIVKVFFKFNKLENQYEFKEIVFE